MKNLRQKLFGSAKLPKMPKMPKLPKLPKLQKLRKSAKLPKWAKSIKFAKLGKFALPLAILLGGVLVSFLFVSTAEKPLALPPSVYAPSVSVQTVAIAPASPTLRIFGEVESPNMSVLTAAVEADIMEVGALEGDTVRRGQALVVLDDVDAELNKLERAAELAEIEAMIESDEVQLIADRISLEAEEEVLNIKRSQVTRYEKLAEKQLGSEASLDEAKEAEQRQLLAVADRRQTIDGAAARRAQLTARRDKAAAALQRAEREHNRARIVAPFDGRITDIMVAPGDRATRGAKLVQLYDDSQLEVRAQIPDAHVPRLRRALDAAQPVRATAIANGTRTELRLHRLSASVIEGQGGIDAFFRAPDAPLPVPGDTVEVQLELPAVEDAVVVSPDSIYGSGRVYLVREEILRAQTVRRIGQLTRDGRQMLIVSGEDFTDGDEILNSRLPQAVEGLKVRVVRE